MPKEIRLNAFEMNCVGHQSPGLWAHPRDRSVDYKDLEYWAELAQVLERGLFDALFIADVLGVYDVYRGDATHAIRHATQVPVNDPLQIVPPMALVTKNLGFGLTCSLSFEHPYPFARRMSTLDHLTKGRAAWNIVTSYLESGARNIGLTKQFDHEYRYDLAEEYLEVCYKLWEGSWEDDAVICDRARRIYADPAKVHEIHHTGRHFTVPGMHLCEPSPQRTPLLYQAGASRRGRAFAAQHAECVFVGATTPRMLARFVADLRGRAEAAGRQGYDVLVFNLMTVIVGETDQAAKKKFDEYKTYASYDGSLALMSGWTGVDFGAFEPDRPLEYVQSNAVQSVLRPFTSADPDRTWTVRELAEWGGVGGLGPVVVGSPQTVADVLQEWVEVSGVDGFNLAYAVTPETFVDVAELLVPELQKRGAYKTAYRPGTLREKLLGRGPRLGPEHPGWRCGQQVRAQGRAEAAAEVSA